MTLRCEWCRSSFERPRSRKRIRHNFCNRRCWGQWKTGRPHKQQRPQLAKRRCLLCSAQYQPTARGQKYCGNQKTKGTCSWKAAREACLNYIKANPNKVKQYQGTWARRLKADPVRYAAYLARCRRKNLSRWGLSPEQYDELKRTQAEVCAICLSPHGHSLSGHSKDLAVDHDHSTGKIRGLLCDDCNIGLGLFRDSPERLRSAAVYLEQRR